MEKQLNVWIYSRVAHKNEYPILFFQADLLHHYAAEHNFAVLGTTCDIDPGISLHANIILPVISAIADDFIDAVLVYSKNRLLCNADAYTEFELFCLMHNVSIITYKDEAHQ